MAGPLGVAVESGGEEEVLHVDDDEGGRAWADGDGLVVCRAEGEPRVVVACEIPARGRVERPEVVVVAEALGTSGIAQVVDLYLNNNAALTPGYVIYENGNPERVVLMNFVTDASGASNYTAYVSVGGNATGQAAATPASVQVK